MVLSGFRLDLDAAVWWHPSGHLLRYAAFFLDHLLWRTSHGKRHFSVCPNNGILRECLDLVQNHFAGFCLTKLTYSKTSYWIDCHTQCNIVYYYNAFLLCVFIYFSFFLKDQTERNRFSVYWKQVGPIVFGSFCLFIFDMCERWANAELPSFLAWSNSLVSI